MNENNKLFKDEENIKEVFNQHIDRIGVWPPAWSDIEDVIREAYWKGVQSGSLAADNNDYGEE